MNSAPLYGLVLAGGRSVRMGEDKGNIIWHGKPQKYHMADTLAGFCSDVYISCRPDQEREIDAPYKPLVDTVEVGGPIAGILSAFERFPGVAFLVVACDLPLLTEVALRELSQKRDPAMIATVFRSPSDQLPEPLIAIWEPISYGLLIDYLGSGLKCPRKFLIKNSDSVLMVDSQSSEALLNANTPQDKQIALSQLRGG